MIFPGGDGIKRMMQDDVTDLPQPVSPTSPRISPRPTLKLTFSSALTIPSSV